MKHAVVGAIHHYHYHLTSAGNQMGGWRGVENIVIHKILLVIFSFIFTNASLREDDIFHNHFKYSHTVM